MTTFVWAIPQTNYLTADGFITTAYWTCTATDGNYTASAYSTCSFMLKAPKIPYANVKKSDVLNWIWANGVNKTATEKSLDAQIKLQKNPVTAAGTPWVA